MCPNGLLLPHLTENPSDSVCIFLACRNSNFALDFFDSFFHEEGQTRRGRHDMRPGSVGVERDDMSEIECNVIAVDIGQFDPHGRTSLFDYDALSGKQDSLNQAITYQRFLPSMVSTGNELISKSSKRRTFTLIRGLLKSGL